LKTDRGFPSIKAVFDSLPDSGYCVKGSPILGRSPGFAGALRFLRGEALSKRAKEMSEKKSYFHVVREKYCKGCGICVAFCPKQVLVLKNGKVFPEKPEACIGCRMCELRCPDYAIEIKEKGAEAAPPRDAGSVDYDIPPEAHHA